ncbi:MAG TPA: glycosyltransferase [Pseudonocardiaceae bacterium]|nr:glycosyltransferase [Pseudonocardiaceae bacterium]
MLIPAHDEADRIAAALDSPHGQTTPPDRIVVVADNCTDDTADVASAHGTQVLPTEGDTAYKARSTRPWPGCCHTSPTTTRFWCWTRIPCWTGTS